MLRFIVLITALLTAAVWLPLIYRIPPHIADVSCPAHEVRVRYPKEMADYHDGPKGMEHYRIASCKPTGIDWRRD